MTNIILWVPAGVGKIDGLSICQVPAFSKIERFARIFSGVFPVKWILRPFAGLFKADNQKNKAARASLPLQRGQKLPQTLCNLMVPRLGRKKFSQRDQKSKVQGMTATASAYLRTLDRESFAIQGKRDSLPKIPVNLKKQCKSGPYEPKAATCLT